MVFPQTQGRMGYPPTPSTDAAIGYSCMGYQSAVIATTKCDADEYCMERYVETDAKAHATPETEVTQRAEVG